MTRAHSLHSAIAAIAACCFAANQLIAADLPHQLHGALALRLLSFSAADRICGPKTKRMAFGEFYQNFYDGCIEDQMAANQCLIRQTDVDRVTAWVRTARKEATEDDLNLAVNQINGTCVKDILVQEVPLAVTNKCNTDTPALEAVAFNMNYVYKEGLDSCSGNPGVEFLSTHCSRWSVRSRYPLDAREKALGLEREFCAGSRLVFR